LSEQQVVETTIEELEGIGKVRAQNLNKLGIVTVKDLAVYTGHELAERSNMSIDTATGFINSANAKLVDEGVLQKPFQTARQVLERRETLLRCTTGSTELDKLFDDGQGHVGIETQAVTEFYAEFGSGKSQLCHTLCATAQLPIEEHGLAGKVIYFDTEGTFRPERVKQIASKRELDYEMILDNVYPCKLQNASQLEEQIQKLTTTIREFSARLIIIDSIMSLHRAEFLGRGTLADRQQKINAMLHKLIKVAEIMNVAVIITNQVQSNPDGNIYQGDPIKAVGGNVLAHASTYRLYIKKAGHNRICTMVDSPSHQYGACKFTITEKGIEDVEEDKK
jgi:DNA repair protein RadA